MSTEDELEIVRNLNQLRDKNRAECNLKNEEKEKSTDDKIRQMVNQKTKKVSNIIFDLAVSASVIDIIVMLFNFNNNCKTFNAVMSIYSAFCILLLMLGLLGKDLIRLFVRYFNTPNFFNIEGKHFIQNHPVGVTRFIGAIGLAFTIAMLYWVENSCHKNIIFETFFSVLFCVSAFTTFNSKDALDVYHATYTPKKKISAFTSSRSNRSNNNLNNYESDLSAESKHFLNKLNCDLYYMQDPIVLALEDNIGLGDPAKNVYDLTCFASDHGLFKHAQAIIDKNPKMLALAQVLFKIDKYQELNLTPNDTDKYVKIQNNYAQSCSDIIDQLLELVKPTVLKETSKLMNSGKIENLKLLPKKYQQKALDSFVKEV